MNDLIFNKIEIPETEARWKGDGFGWYCCSYCGFPTGARLSTCIGCMCEMDNPEPEEQDI